MIGIIDSAGDDVDTVSECCVCGDNRGELAALDDEPMAVGPNGNFLAIATVPATVDDDDDGVKYSSSGGLEELLLLSWVARTGSQYPVARHPENLHPASDAHRTLRSAHATRS